MSVCVCVCVCARARVCVCVLFPARAVVHATRTRPHHTRDEKKTWHARLPISECVLTCAGLCVTYPLHSVYRDLVRDRATRGCPRRRHLPLRTRTRGVVPPGARCRTLLHGSSLTSHRPSLLSGPKAAKPLLERMRVVVCLRGQCRTPSCASTLVRVGSWGTCRRPASLNHLAVSPTTSLADVVTAHDRACAFALLAQRFSVLA